MIAIGVWREMSVLAKMQHTCSNSAQSKGRILYFVGQLCTFFALWLRAKLISLIGGNTVDPILLRLFNECMKAFGSVDKEGLILA
jgi:hypothetical protein